jgi:hypothetical protein
MTRMTTEDGGGVGRSTVVAEAAAANGAKTWLMLDGLFQFSRRVVEIGESGGTKIRMTSIHLQKPKFRPRHG